MAGVNFNYESVENVVRLLVTLQFEKTQSVRDICVYHKRFEQEPDTIFGEFLEQVFPDGTVVDTPQITMLVEHICSFLKKDPVAKKLYVEYDKSNFPSWVYFKPDDVVYSVAFGEHTSTIQNICKDFFKGFEASELSRDYVKQFLRENFEIKSSNTTIENIIDDVDWLIREIIINARFKGE